MAISVNANITSADLATTPATTTITKPTGTAATDILTAIFASSSTANPTNATTAPSGWTAINTAFTVVSGSTLIRLHAFWALGNVAALGFTNSLTGGTYQQGWTCVGFLGVDNTTPIDAVGTTNSNTGAASLTTNLVTVVTANAWHCIAFGDWLGKVPFAATSFTEKNNTGANAAAALLYNTTPKSTGSTGTVAVNNNGSVATAEILAAMPFALRPAAGGFTAKQSSFFLGYV